MALKKLDILAFFPSLWVIFYTFLRWPVRHKRGRKNAYKKTKKRKIKRKNNKTERKKIKQKEKINSKRKDIPEKD